MHYIMEPVFDKLGIRLISRNMAMGGVGTLQFSLAGKDLYGEADVLLWDSGMTEKGATVDLFNKQAILAGERMPILLTSEPYNIMEEMEGEANFALRKTRKDTKTILSPSQSNSFLEKNTALHRQLNSSSFNGDIIPGRGWEISGWILSDEFCDGSSMSACGRFPGSTCLASGHNDKHVALAGNSLSGWLVFVIPKVREGVVLARMEWWCGVSPAITANWTEVNDGKTNDHTPYLQRNLVASQNQGSTPTIFSSDSSNRFLRKPTTDELVPPDFAMDYAVNGVIKTMEREEWLSHATEPSKNCAVWPLLNDIEMARKENWDGEDLEIAIRFRSEINPRAGFCISHIYFA
jgi:hypothetical protein